jgi:hypothetical protein
MRNPLKAYVESHVSQVNQDAMPLLKKGSSRDSEGLASCDHISAMSVPLGT